MITMIPFLSQEKLLELHEKIQENNGNYNGISEVVTYPFLNQDNLSLIIDKKIETSQSITVLLPFISNEKLDILVEKYISGDLKVNIDTWMPFLSSDQIEKIFDYKMTK